MATIYYKMIKSGDMSIEKVPDKWRAKVQAMLETEGEQIMFNSEQNSNLTSKINPKLTLISEKTYNTDANSNTYTFTKNYAQVLYIGIGSDNQYSGAYELKSTTISDYKTLFTSKFSDTEGGGGMVQVLIILLNDVKAGDTITHYSYDTAKEYIYDLVNET